MNINKKIISLSAITALLALPITTWAILDIKDIINNVMDIIVWPIFIGAVVIMFIWAGILFVMAQGDPSKIATAKKAVFWAIIGAAVGVVAFSIVDLITAILGV